MISTFQGYPTNQKPAYATLNRANPPQFGMAITLAERATRAVQSIQKVKLTRYESRDGIGNKLESEKKVTSKKDIAKSLLELLENRTSERLAWEPNESLPTLVEFTRRPSDVLPESYLAKATLHFETSGEANTFLHLYYVRREAILDALRAMLQQQNK